MTLQDQMSRPSLLMNSYLGRTPDREDLEARVAYVYETAENSPGSQFDYGFDVQNPPVEEWKFVWNRPEVHQMVLPSGGGIATAEDLARFYGMLSNGGAIDDVRILKPDTIERAIKRTNRPGEVDRRMRITVAWGIGFMIGDGPDGAVLGARDRVTDRSFGHPGAACVTAWGDLDRRIGAAYCTNGNSLFLDGIRRSSELGDLILKAAL